MKPKIPNEAIQSALLQQHLLWRRYNKLHAICTGEKSTALQWQERAAVLKEWGEESENMHRNFEAHKIAAEYNRMLIAGVIK